MVGQTFQLLSSDGDGKVLMVDTTGRLFFDHPGLSDTDAEWTFVDCDSSVPGEEQPKCIVSKTLGMAINYGGEDDELVRGKRFDDVNRHTHWYVTKDGEFYCIPDLGTEGTRNKKYIWSTFGKDAGDLFTTSDEYLAETFRAITKEGHDVLFSKKSTTRYFVWALIFFALCAFLIWWWLKRNSRM